MRPPEIRADDLLVSGRGSGARHGGCYLGNDPQAAAPMWRLALLGPGLGYHGTNLSC